MVGVANLTYFGYKLAKLKYFIYIYCMKKYKLNRKLVTVTCDHCNNSFEKPKSEYQRNISLSRKNFCSRTCKGKNYVMQSIRNPNAKKAVRPKGYGNPFKYYLKCAKSRFKKCNITIEILENQWNKQEGICPYSGLKLQLNSHTNKIKNKIELASLDRIDSSKGYIEGNIQFVSQCINLMKNTMSHEETLKMCKIITKNWLARSFPLD